MKVFSMICAALSLVVFNAFAKVPTQLPQKTKAQIESKKKNESLRKMSSEAPAAQQSVIAPRKSTGAWIQQRLSVGVFVSTASEFKASSWNLISEQGAVSLPSPSSESSSALGIEARLQDQLSGPIGWYGAISIDQTRSFNSVNVLDGKLKFTGDFTITPIVLSGGPRVQINKDFYAFGGLNRTMMTNTTSITNGGFSADPLVGYQFGVGVQAQKNLGLELNYRALRYDITISEPAKTNKFNETNLSGLNLQGSYKF